MCRTDLHLALGELPPRRPGVVLGHEVVGTVDEVGAGTQRFAVGDRIGVPWLAGTDGTCRFCRRGRGVTPITVSYPMAEAHLALADLADGRYSGAAVLHN